MTALLLASRTNVKSKVESDAAAKQSFKGTVNILRIEVYYFSSSTTCTLLVLNILIIARVLLVKINK